MKKISIIAAPTNLGLCPDDGGKLSGVTKLPAALLANGLQHKLQAEFQIEIPVPAYSAEKDAAANMLNPHGIREFSIDLADAVEEALGAGKFPLVLGGDCSILLGCLLALRRCGRYGLFFLDGHADFYLPDQSETGGAAGMDLAFATGRGPDILSDLEGRSPLIREEDVIVCGFRDMEESVPLQMTKLSETRLHTLSLPEFRQTGIRRAISRGLEILETNTPAGFWIHIDADVLEDQFMPAVDARQPGGLSYSEFTEILGMLLSSGSTVGLHVGILDPDLDPDGRIVKEFTERFAKCFKGIL